MRTTNAAIGCAIAALLLFGCFDAPEVLQGTVASYDAGAQALVVRDERPPHEQTTFVLAGSELGADLQPGDEVRVAYVADGERKRAVRVMNLTRQAELGKRGKPAADAH